MRYKLHAVLISTHMGLDEVVEVVGIHGSTYVVRRCEPGKVNLPHECRDFELRPISWRDAEIVESAGLFVGH